MAETDDLLDYEEADEQEDVIPDGAGDGNAKKELKGTYVSIHSSGFRDFLLKPELLRAIVDCGFEHPSEGSLYSLEEIRFIFAFYWLCWSLGVFALSVLITVLVGEKSWVEWWSYGNEPNIYFT